MPAFGPSNAQKQAEGFFPAQGMWNEEQYREWLARMQQMGLNAEEWGPWAVDYFQNVATHGIGTPQDIRDYGNWAMPGRQPVIDARTGRLNQIGADFDTTAGGMQDRWTNLAGGIGSNYDIVQGDINDAFGQIGRRGEAVHGDVEGNIGTTYGGARQNVTDTMTGLRQGSFGTFDPMIAQTGQLYGGLQGRSTGRFGDLGGRSAAEFGGLQGRSADLYGGLQQRGAERYGGLQGRSTGRYGELADVSAGRFGELGGRAGDIYGALRGDVDATIGGLQAGNVGAYGTAANTLDVLNPAGDAAAARATRSYAPQVAATKGRLRAAGIDPNSPEAASILGRVEAQRSRATEDAYTDAARNYVDRSTALTLGQEGINRDLGLAGLAQRQGLGQAEEEIGRGLGLGELQNYLGLGENELQNYQNLGLGEMADYARLGESGLQNYQQLGIGGLMNAQQLGLGEMQNYQGLATEGAGVGRDLALQRLMNEQGLTERGLGMDVNLGLQGGAATREEMLRNLNQTTGLDLERLGQSTGNRNRAFDQTVQWTQGVNALDQSINQQRADLGREQNAEELWRYGFDVMQPYQMGNEFLTQQERIRSGAAGPVMNAGNAAAGQAAQAANVAQNFGNTAAQNYGQTIQTESPNASWLTKLLGGAAGAALGGLTGGMAGAPSWMRGIYGAATGGAPSYAGGGYPGQPYGSGANPYNPMIFSNQPYVPQMPDYSIVPQRYRLPGGR